MHPDLQPLLCAWATERFPIARATIVGVAFGISDEAAMDYGPALTVDLAFLRDGKRERVSLPQDRYDTSAIAEALEWVYRAGQAAG